MNLQEFIKDTKEKTQQLWKNRADPTNYKITGSWLRGFIESDGSFISDNTKNKPLFEISQHFSDFVLMNGIKTFFQCGSTRFESRIDKKTGRLVQMCIYRMSSPKEIEDKLLPLLKKGFVLPNKKESYKHWLNNYFPNFKAPSLSLKDSFDTDWLIGFTDGDGSFYFRIDKVTPKLVNEKIVKQSQTGFQIRCAFDLAQKDSELSLRDLGMLIFLENHHKKPIFETYTNSKDNVSHLRITSFKSLQFYVKPIFSNQSLQSRKCIDWYLWKNGLFLMENKYHLFEEGIKAYNEFQDCMEFYRVTPPPPLSSSE